VTPKPGYQFVKWHKGSGFLCGDSTNLTCTFTMPADANLATTVIGVFATGYMMPVYKDVGIDTDGDGLRNELDSDDDNDGVLDVDDPCPINAYANGGCFTVSGNLYQPTTWTNENGPIRIVGSMYVHSTLTVGEGVEIIGDGNTISASSSGTINISGAKINKLFIGHADSSRISIASSHFVGGSPSIGHSEYGSYSLTDSVLENVQMNAALSNGGCSVARNIFLGDTKLKLYKHTFSAYGISASIKNNLFLGYSSDVISTQIAGWIQADNPTVVISGNSFLEEGVPTFNLTAYAISKLNILIQNNFWGTTDTSVIEQMIFESSTISPGDIEYLPILENPDPITPTL